MQLGRMLQDRTFLDRITGLSKQAGSAILAVYMGDHIKVTHKQDNSPLTQADMTAHRIIIHGLTKLTPQIPVLSEESDTVSYALRSRWTTYWLVDPLDGTKEFLEKNGEFTVNIALICRGIPVFGVVYAPVRDLLYMGVQLDEKGLPNEKINPSNSPEKTNHLPERWATRQAGTALPERIRVRALPASNSLTVVASRRHGNEALEACLARLRQEFSPLTTSQIGSSLKICMIAEGSADFYPRYAPTCEWDTAAAQAVLEAAGGMLTDDRMNRLRYNSKESLLNPHFYAFGDVTYNWSALLGSMGNIGAT